MLTLLILKLDDFSKQKIVWSDISTSPQFSLVKDDVFINNTAYMITGTHSNIVHILNSKITSWYFPKISSDLGKGSRYFKQFVELLPLPNIGSNEFFYDGLTEINVDSQLRNYYKFSKLEAEVIGLT